MLGFVEGLGGYMMLPRPLGPHSLIGEMIFEEPNHGRIQGVALQAVHCLRSDK